MVTSHNALPSHYGHLPQTSPLPLWSPPTMLSPPTVVTSHSPLPTSHYPLPPYVHLTSFLHLCSDRKDFLTTWKDIPQQNEIQTPIEGVELGPGIYLDVSLLLSPQKRNLNEQVLFCILCNFTCLLRLFLITTLSLSLSRPSATETGIEQRVYHRSSLGGRGRPTPRAALHVPPVHQRYLGTR